MINVELQKEIAAYRLLSESLEKEAKRLESSPHDMFVLSTTVNMFAAPTTVNVVHDLRNYVWLLLPKLIAEVEFLSAVVEGAATDVAAAQTVIELSRENERVKAILLSMRNENMPIWIHEKLTEMLDPTKALRTIK